MFKTLDDKMGKVLPSKEPLINEKHVSVDKIGIFKSGPAHWSTSKRRLDFEKGIVYSASLDDPSISKLLKKEPRSLELHTDEGEEDLSIDDDESPRSLADLETLSKRSILQTYATASEDKSFPRSQGIVQPQTVPLAEQS